MHGQALLDQLHEEPPGTRGSFALRSGDGLLQFLKFEGTIITMVSLNSLVQAMKRRKERKGKSGRTGERFLI